MTLAHYTLARVGRPLITLSRAFHRLLLAAMAVYGPVLLILAGVWIFLPGYNKWLDLTNIFALYFFVPLVPLLFIALLLRSKALLLPTVGLLALAGALFVPYMLPNRLSAPAEATGQTLRVATFNMMYNTTDPASSAAVLAAQGADIVALQEVVPSTVPAIDQLREQYPYQDLRANTSPGGIGILSRYPIEQVEEVASLRGLRAVINVEGQRITVIAIHPSPPVGLDEVPVPFIGRSVHLPTYDPSGRNTVELEPLLAEITQIEGPLVVAGDFNTSDREPMYQRFAALLHDTYGEAGWGLGYTFPNPRHQLRLAVMPRVRIDYIWSSDELVPVSAQVNCAATATDHCMVLADLAR